MKKWMKTAAAAFIGAAICTAAGSLSASADVTPDGDTLKLSGNVTVDEVQAYANKEAVKKVVCEPGTVFPENSQFLFNNFTYAESIDLSNADTSQVTNMSDMFTWCKELTSLDLGSFKTDNVTRMSYMFYACEKLKNLDLSNFNTENVESMSYMFCESSSLESLDLSGFNTSKVIYANEMFGGCNHLETLDLSSFDFSQDADLRQLFFVCTNLKTIYVSDNWNLNAEAKSENMFGGCIKLVGENGTAYDANHTDKEYARIDGKDGQPGYFTFKFSDNYVKGASLSLDGKIGVNFHVSLNSKAFTVVVNGPGTTIEYPVSQIGMYKQDDGSYKIPVYVNATQAGEAVTLKILDEAGEQLDLYNSDFEKLDNGTVSYSVNEYIADSAQYADDENVKALVKALDSYCKAATNYFTGSDLAVETAGSVSADDFDLFVPMLAGTKMALVLDAGTAIRIFYDGSETTAQLEGRSFPLYIQEKNGSKYFEIENIAAHELDHFYGMKIGTKTLAFCPLSYGYLAHDLAADKTELTTLVNALYAYSEAAWAYQQSLAD